jgi:membrane protein YqaA with SNARE-associated domain
MTKERAMNENLAGVFALAIIELWAAIPLGVHLKLHPALLIVAAASGAFLGALVAIYLGDGIRRLVFWRKKENAGGGRMSKWLAAKGPWAIGLLGPVLIGPLFAAAMAGALGLPRRSSLALLAAGIVGWTAAFSVLGTLGLAALRQA